MKASLTKKRLLIGSIPILLLTVISVWFFTNRGPAEPVYSGHPLSYWLEDRAFPEVADDDDFRKAEDKITSVLESVGSEALPWLISATRRYNHSSTVGLCYLKFDQKQAWAEGHLPRPWEIGRPFAEENALRLLGRIAPGTPHEKEAAELILSADWQTRPDYAKRRILFLSRFTNCPSVVVPILVAGLTNSGAQEAAMETLPAFILQATPAIYQMALSETGYARPAEGALQRINPTAYEKLKAEKESKK